MSINRNEDEDEDSNDDDDDDDELFRVKPSSRKKNDDINELDSTRFKGDELELHEWRGQLAELAERTASKMSLGDEGSVDTDEEDDDDEGDEEEEEEDDVGSEDDEDDENDEEDDGEDAGGELSKEAIVSNFIASLRNRFVTGNWGKEDEQFDDFEDMETGEVFTAKGEVKAPKDDDGDDASDDSDRENDAIDEQLRRANAKKKANARATFDSEYDERKLVWAECFSAPKHI